MFLGTNGGVVANCERGGARTGEGKEREEEEEEEEENAGGSVIGGGMLTNGF